MTLLCLRNRSATSRALRAHAEYDPAAAKRVALDILYCVEQLLAENPKLGSPGRAARGNWSSPKRPTLSPTA